MEKKVKCSICKTECEYGEMYEYRGALSCEKCFDELQIKRNAERQQIIDEEKHKTDRFKGLNLSNDSIGERINSIYIYEKIADYVGGSLLFVSAVGTLILLALILSQL